MRALSARLDSAAGLRAVSSGSVLAMLFVGQRFRRRILKLGGGLLIIGSRLRERHSHGSRRRLDRQHIADRLDPMLPTMIVDEGDHCFDRRSSSAIAK